jgi:hypothetical protein
MPAKVLKPKPESELRKMLYMTDSRIVPICCDELRDISLAEVAVFRRAAVTDYREHSGLQQQVLRSLCRTISREKQVNISNIRVGALELSLLY